MADYYLSLGAYVIKSPMPRKMGIDAQGALHHVIGLGFAREMILLSSWGRDDLSDRLGPFLTEQDKLLGLGQYRAGHMSKPTSPTLGP
jgi:hypothetical protein